MKWSFSLGRVLGIELRIHATFLLLLAFVTLAQWLRSGDVRVALVGLAFFSALFLCVVLHEYGHALMARRYGVATHDITLLPIGGLARLERMPDTPSQELWIALAGPAVNIVIAALLAGWLAIAGDFGAFSAVDPVGGSFVASLLAINLFLVAFNMLPAFPMDGGRVLRAVLAMRLDYARATRIAASIGQGMAVLFGLFGLFSQPMQPILILIALFVWIGAAEEAAAAEMKHALRGVTARDAMITDYVVLDPRETIGDAARLLLAGSQRDFPVVEESSVVGIVSHDRLIRGLRESDEHASVTGIMDRSFNTALVDEPLDAVLARREPERCRVVPVYSGDRLVGLITSDNIGELLMVRSALAAREGRGGPPRGPGGGRHDHSLGSHGAAARS